MRKILAVSVLFVLWCLAAAAEAGHVQARMLVDTSWLAEHMNDKNLVILHVGADRAAYDAQHIPGARFLSLSEIAVTRNGVPNELPSLEDLKSAFERAGVGDRSRVVLYGERAGLLAARAWFTLDYLGHADNAALLDGGLEQWTAEHRPVSSESPSVTRATLTVKAHPELLVQLSAVKKIVAEKKIALLDARPAKDFVGTPGMARTGHIPGARNVFWVDNIVSLQQPRLNPPSDIRARYEAAGLEPGSSVVVYCQTGIQAAHDYFTLRLTGFRPVLYDGSLAEWSKAADTQVVQ